MARSKVSFKRAGGRASKPRPRRSSARRGAVTGALLTAWRWGIATLAFGLVFLFMLYATLPDVRPLAAKNPETTAFIEQRAREARAKGEKPRRDQRWVPYARISSNLKRAVLTAEDSGFFDHDGVDFDQIRESIEVNLEKFEFSRGASTLTQQLAKNLYLSPSKNPVRKFREVLLARALEAALTKRRIFEIYLNVIEWGDGTYGAEAAARRYFGSSAASLSAEQAALLAGAIVNPRVLTPSAPPRRLLARQRLILRRMARWSPPSTSATSPSSAAAPSSAASAAASSPPASSTSAASSRSPASPSSSTPTATPSTPAPVPITPSDPLPGAPTPAPAPPATSPLPSSRPPSSMEATRRATPRPLPQPSRAMSSWR